ncbi:MAG: hypothetical protein ACKOZZ_17740 [Bacteroidota bacterium]
MRFITLCCLIIVFGKLSAQKEEPTLFFTAKYGAQLPALDFARRFGSSLRTTAILSYQQPGKLSVWGVTGFFQFGSLVKENIFSNLLTPEGYLIGNDKNPASIQLRQRAWFIGFGRGWRFKEKTALLNRFSLDIHGGFFQHKIRIQEDPARLVPQINGAYKKGYDRLSNGPGLCLNMSYNPTANPALTRFVVGADLFIANTFNRRSINFDTGLRDEAACWVFQPGIHLAYHFKKVFRDPGSLKY